MSYIRKQQCALEQKALDYLRSTLYKNCPTKCPSSLYLWLSKSDRERNYERYQMNLKIFKTLFNNSDSSLNLALWNTISISPNDKLYKKDFTDKEYKFLTDLINAQKIPIYETNVNAPITTKRLILRALNKNDSNLFAYHFMHDGDFVRFTGRKPSAKAVRFYANRRFPALFTIEEKTTHAVVGYIGLFILKPLATGLLEYYIFKEYRKRGYCKEVALVLIQKALNKKLYEPVATVQEYIYKKKAIKINAVRARIAVTNTASINTVKSCGFIHEASLHQTMFKNDSWEDEELYYITKEMLEGMKINKLF